MLNLPFLCIIVAAAHCTFMSSAMDIITKAKGSGGSSKHIHRKKLAIAHLSNLLNNSNPRMSLSSKQLQTMLTIILIQEYTYKKIKNAQKSLTTLALMSTPYAYNALHSTLEETRQAADGCWIKVNNTYVFKPNTYALTTLEGQLLYERVANMRLAIQRGKMSASCVVNAYKKQLEFAREQKRLFEKRAMHADTQKELDMVEAHFRLKQAYAEFIVSYGSFPLITLAAKMKEKTYMEELPNLPLNSTPSSLIVAHASTIVAKSWLGDLHTIVNAQLPQFKTVLSLSQAWLSLFAQPTATYPLAKDLQATSQVTTAFINAHERTTKQLQQTYTELYRLLKNTKNELTDFNHSKPLPFIPKCSQVCFQETIEQTIKLLMD